MSNINQQGGIAIPGADVPFKNYGVSAIAAGLGVLLDTGNPGTDTALAGIVLPTNSGGVVGTLGVTLESIAAGGVGRVRMAGAAVCTAYSSITAGTIVQIADTTAHLGQVKTCGAGVAQLGIAMNGAADTEQVRVWICQAKNS